MAIHDELIRLGTTNPELRHHIRPLLAAAKELKEVDTNKIRKAYYDCADGTVGLREAVAVDSVTKGDKVLKAAVGDLGKALDKVHDVLNNSYIWD